MKPSQVFDSELRFFVSFVFLQCVSCLFEDQVGKFDWRQQYIGKIKGAYIDPLIAGTHKFIVVTEENTLACLSSRTGSIIWRQILERDDLGEINSIAEEGDLMTVNGNGQFLRNWDPNTGVLQGETSFPHQASNDAILFFKVSAASKQIIKVEIIPKQHAQVFVYSYSSASMKTSEKVKAMWYNDNINCSFISSNWFVCLEGRNLQLLSVKEGAAFMTVKLPDLGIDATDSTSLKIMPVPYQDMNDNCIFAIGSDNKVQLIHIVHPGVKVILSLPTESLVTSTIVDDRLILFSITSIKEDNLIKYAIKGIHPESSKDLQHLEGSFSLSEDRGELLNFYILPYIRKDQAVSYKILMLFEDHSVLLVHHQGRLLWFREEALSSIISTEIMDLPLSETDANIEQEFGQADASVFSMFLTRIKSQVNLLQTFILNTIIGIKGDIDKANGDKKPLTRDNFGLHKIIVVITKPGKVLGIDNLSGLIVWSHFVKNLSPFMVLGKLELPLFVQRTTSHFPYPPVCTAVGEHPISKKGRIYSFDPITGEIVENKYLTFKIMQVMTVGTLDNFLRDILILDSNLKVHIHPEKHNIHKHKNNHFMFISENDKGTITGFKLTGDKDNTLKASEAWKIALPQPIIKIVSKRPSEMVHSQGRVMGDRSVLYKYSNPNLATVFTEGHDLIQKSFCNIYLIDMVTGLVVYSASHKRCRPPLQVVHSENWVVYSFYNDKSRRFEISSAELFEGMYQSNTTAFSSFSPPPLPLVEHQTFIFPSAIDAIADTVTERGMTSKHILIALPSGGILELPKTYLDPRRPINPLPEHREEGLIPYIPQLPILPEGMINYNQSITHVQKIVTAPSALESTCLVFVHGLDLFYTRVTPSKTFDILKDDFDHYLISVVLLGLLLLSYTTKRLAARKSLRAAWK